MTHATKLMSLTVAVLSCAVFAAANEGALNQLHTAAPQGPAAVQVVVPVVKGAPRGEAQAARSQDDSADRYIAEFAEAAYKEGDVETARLLVRLVNDGTIKEKAAFIAQNGKGQPYRFPERFYWKTGIVKVDNPICHWVTTTVCKLACHGWGEQRQCEQDCHDIIVKSCDN